MNTTTRYTTETLRRNTDIILAARQYLANRKTNTCSLRSLSQIIAAKPAPRYYLCYDRAQRILSRLRRRNDLRWQTNKAYRQWSSLNTAVDRLQRARSLPFNRALQTVLTDHPAPSFFLSPQTIQRILRTKQSL